jgi:hypothetical protein
VTEARWSDERVTRRQEAPPEAPQRLLFARTVRGATGAFARPLPPALEALADERELERHAQLVERSVAARQRVRELTAALQAARVDDEHQAREAALVGDELPAPRVPELERELLEAERELGTLSEATPQSAQELLDSVASEAAQARAEALARGRGGIEAVLAELERLEAEFERGAAALLEVHWLDGLRTSGSAPPFAGAGGGDRELRRIRGNFGELRNLLEMALERESAEPAALTSDDSMMWHESHRLRPRAAREAANAGTGEPD